MVDTASLLGMTDEEIREQLSNAGFDKGELGNGHLPYTPPEEWAG